MNPSSGLTTARAGRRSARAVPDLLEADFQRLITDAATALGWRWVHFGAAQTKHGWRVPVRGTMGEGWVDLLLVHGKSGRIILAELKTRTGTISPAQTELHEWLRSIDGLRGRLQVAVWRPADLDRILEILE